MLFNTIQFGIFFAIVLGLYYVLPHKWQNRMLLVASYLFYAAWDWRFVSLILISTTVDFYVGKLLYETSDVRKRKFILIWSIIFNLGFLGFFKYYDFFATSLQGLFAVFGWHISPTILHIVLPVGISFYTFQSMSYTLDIYRNELKPSKSFLNFALSVAFFPHMVAGPIQRAQSLIDQVAHPRTVTRSTFAEGFYLIMWGLFKKVVIADNMAKIVNPIFAQNEHFTATQVIVGAVAFAFQIYGDFSGYSDMARGPALLMGFRLMVNFNLPYFASNPQDFWRRWHISLSTWLRDYLYISLGGNRISEARTYFNLFITMLIGGLWHGASWTFVIWGAYHGVLLMGHRAVQSFIPEAPLGESAAGQFVWKWGRIAFMFCLTLLGWLIFRAASFSQLYHMLQALAAINITPALAGGFAKILFYCAILLLVQLYQFKKNDLDAIRRSPVLLQSGFYLVCFYLILIIGAFDAQSFIYFQF
jgi:alginate O-acetyltransferase complex protein AlgI